MALLDVAPLAVRTIRSVDSIQRFRDAVLQEYKAKRKRGAESANEIPPADHWSALAQQEDVRQGGRAQEEED